jgi:hypothetical protein
LLSGSMSRLPTLSARRSSSPYPVANGVVLKQRGYRVPLPVQGVSATRHGRD